jgi:hypothetical protein
MYPKLDIDNKNGLTLLTNYFNNKYFFGNRIQIDETRKGYHIIILVGVHPKTTLVINAAAKDIDKARLLYDYIRFIQGKYYMMQILFSNKGGHKKLLNINPLYHPWKNDRIPAKHYQQKEVV